MTSTRHTLFIALILTVFVLSPGFSQETEHGDHGENEVQDSHDEHADEAEHEEDGDAESHGSRPHHLNDIGIFLGATDEHGHPTEFTWGIDYKRRVAERWAVGGFFDYAGGLRNAIVAASVTWLPVAKLSLTAAPGIEFHQGRGPTAPHKSDDPENIGLFDEDATYFVMRFGVGWGFPIGKSYALEPQVNLDLVNGEKVWVYGVNFIYAW